MIKVSRTEYIAVDGVVTTIETLQRQAYDKALEDFEAKIKECCSVAGSCDFEDMKRIKEQLIK